MWNPAAQSDQENLMWCWLRAVEWGNWPMFISQPIAPLLMLVWPWQIVATAAIVANIFWAIFIRYNVVVPAMAYWGAFLVKMKWIACPLAAYLLYLRGDKIGAAIAFFWPFVVIVIGHLPPPKIGRIQKLFMQCFGYQPTEENPLNS